MSTRELSRIRRKSGLVALALAKLQKVIAEADDPGDEMIMDAMRLLIEWRHEHDEAVR